MKEESALTRKPCHKAAFIISLMLINTLLGLTSFVNASNTNVAISLVNPTSGDEEFIFYTNVTTIGHRFNVTVLVSNVTDLFAYQIFLTYNSQVINATQAWLPKWNPQWVFYEKTTVSPDPFLDDAVLYEGEIVGVIQIGDSLLGDEPTFNGTGILALIQFEVLTNPNVEEELSTILSINNDDTYLLNPELTIIPAAKLDGIYRYVWLEPGLKVVPPEYVAVFPNETFNITVYLHNVTVSDRLVEVKFKLRYNVTLLNLTSPLVVEGDFLPQFNNTSSEPSTEFQFSIHTGYLNVSIKILPNSTGHWNNFPEGNGAIAIVSFIGIHQDSEEHFCKLELFDVELRDDSSNLMKMTPPKDGFYKILSENASFITINVYPSSTNIGSNVTVNGTVKPPAKGINVTIFTRPVNGNWTILKTVQTDVDGSYNYTWTVERLGIFELKANTTDAESSVVSLTVDKRLSKITLYASPPSVPLGSNVTLTGSVNPVKVGINITIYCRRTGEEWYLLATAKTKSEGNFSYVWKTTQSGAFELYAWWPGDENTSEATSQIVAVTVEKLPSQITINLSSSTVTFGSKITIQGKIVPHRPDKDVAIWYKKVGANLWVKLNTRTDTNSQYHYLWEPTEAGDFELYASWTGDENTKSAVSEIKTLTVNPANTTITLDASPKTIVIGSNVTLYGTILPQLPNVSLTIYYKAVEKVAWEALTTVNTSQNGEYHYIWTPNICTEFQLYTSWKGNVNTYSANSSIITVKVLRLNSTITLEIIPSTITIGSSALIKGRIRPNRINATVTIYFRLKGEESWNKLKEVKTDVNSTFYYTWQMNQTGVFEIKTVWKGDAITNGAESQIKTITVESERKDEQLPLILLTVSVLLIVSLALTLLYFLKIRK
jgi:5-hydroxyisourate hydrolase-like protein (transthyretin family)